MLHSISRMKKKKHWIQIKLLYIQLLRISWITKLHFLFLCPSLCVCFVFVYMCLWKPDRNDEHFSQSPLYFWDRVYHRTWAYWLDKASWPASPDPPVSSSSVLALQMYMAWLLWECRRSTSCSHGCIASTLPTKPPSQPPCFLKGHTSGMIILLKEFPKIYKFSASIHSSECFVG